MPSPEICLIILPTLFSALALLLDGYMKRFPSRCDDLWRLPRTTQPR